MKVHIFSDKGSLVFVVRKQRDGKRKRLFYYPSIKADAEWDSVKQQHLDSDVQRRVIRIVNIINEILEERDFFSLAQSEFVELIGFRLTGKVRHHIPFFDYCEEYFEKRKAKHGYTRAKQYQTTIRLLRLFDSEMTFEGIDDFFYKRLVDWMEKKEYSLNYIGKTITNLRTFCKEASEDGVNKLEAYKHFKAPKEEVYNIYLTDEEVERIYNLKLTESLLVEKLDTHVRGCNVDRQLKALDHARKLFIVGCCTGLRVENYASIDPDIQVVGNFLHAIANKNGPKLKIPLHRFVKEILLDGFPHPMSGQKLNQHVKQLGLLAGIVEPIMYTKTEGSNRRIITERKCDLITTHTARRSFASNLLLKGVPKAYIMAVTGHKKESSFNKYVAAVEKDILSSKLGDFDVWG